MYQLRILDAAIHELSKLDKSIWYRVVNRLHWLTSNLNNIKPEALTGELAGLYKLRVGDYRVIYEILHEEHTILIHLIGHRKEIYRN